VHDRTGRLVGGTRNGHVLQFDGVPPVCVTVPKAPPMMMTPIGDAMVPMYVGETYETEVYRRSQQTGADGHRLYLLEAVR